MKTLSNFIKNNKVSLASEVIIFSAASFFTLTAAFKIVGFVEVGFLPPPQPLKPLELILALFIATLIMLLVPLWLGRGSSGLKRLFFKAMFLAAVYFGGILFLAMLLEGILALLLMLLLVFLWLLKPFVWLHNLILILAISGLAAFWGISLSPLTAIVFLAAMSVYDFIAVYKTRHMVFMAKEMIEAGSPLAFVLPQNPAGFWASASGIKTGGGFIFLGGGDVALPLLLAVSLAPQGLEMSLIVAFFGLIGSLSSLFLLLSQKQRRPLPALPPITLACLIGYLLTRLI